MADKCKECGCACGECRKNDENHADVHLHVEIENLRQRLLERDSHIVTMETQFLNEADKFPNGELASMKEEMLAWQDKYSRLYEAHKRVQKVNQNLEDKLLRIVDKCETEKSAFTKDIATLSHRLADANYTIHRLTQDNEKYRNDVNLAIQLLQCKPSNFVGQRYDSLPSEVQAKVRTYVAQKRVSNDAASVSDVKSITVPISTFPPTAMVYNVTKTNNVDKDSDEESDDSKPPVDIVSAAIMAKVLEERERERVFAKHCDTCTCHRSILTNDAETQTGSGNDGRDSESRANVYLDNVNYRNQSMTSNQNLNTLGDRDSVDKTNVSSIGKQQQQRNTFEMQYVNEKLASHTQTIPSKKLDNFVNVSTEKETQNSSMRLASLQSNKTGDNSTLEKKLIRKNYCHINDKDVAKKKIVTTNCRYSEIEKESSSLNVGKNVITSSDKLSFKYELNNEEKSTSVRKTNRIGLKKIDETPPQSVYKLTNGNKSDWKKYDKVSREEEIDLIDLKENIKSERQIDITNNRILKNEDNTWRVKRALITNKKIEELNFYGDTERQRRQSETTIWSDDTSDVINERVWKTIVDGSSRSDSNTGIGKQRLTLIEVKPLISDLNSATNIMNSQLEDRHQQNESSSSTGLQQSSTDTASPSFSSDSLVISSSDPPSTSSEFGNNRITVKKMSINNLNNNNIINNNNNNINNNINNNNNNVNNNNNNNNQNQNQKNKNSNGSSLMSNWQDRTTGPRGCSMRITPGSKNILLDNAGHYQTILYTSGGGNGNGKPSTALVHNVSKSIRSGGSASTSSDDNSPVLPADNTQLQRVAEWIKASDNLERETCVKSFDSIKFERKLSDDMSVNTLNKALIKIKDGKSQQQKEQKQQLMMNGEVVESLDDFQDDDDDDEEILGDKKKVNSKTAIYHIDKNDVGIDVIENCVTVNDDNKKMYSNNNRSGDIDTAKNNSYNADLISFESSNDEIEDSQQFDSSSSNICRDLKIDDSSDIIDESLSKSVSRKIIDVKITKEMEETYLKLAASLDPANLELSSSESADITIEKYRKKYKRNNGVKLIGSTPAQGSTS